MDISIGKYHLKHNLKPGIKFYDPSYSTVQDIKSYFISESVSELINKKHQFHHRYRSDYFITLLSNIITLYWVG